MGIQQGFYSATVLIAFVTEVCEEGTYGNKLFSAVLLGTKISPQHSTWVHSNYTCVGN